jgi:hypothetical protein
LLAIEASRIPGTPLPDHGPLAIYEGKGILGKMEGLSTMVRKTHLQDPEMSQQRQPSPTRPALRWRVAATRMTCIMNRSADTHNCPGQAQRSKWIQITRE